MIDPTDHFQRQWENMDPATAEINRLSDKVSDMQSLISDLIQGARRDRSIISPKVGLLHVIETRVTKGQVLKAIEHLKEQPKA